ncbi:MAG TPA: DUF192 domain-containing protein [Candidatus Paceibacterota bacterium]|nr:DUF192 domain-containing protein [Candidatus Paceibacterota bacterium]
MNILFTANTDLTRMRGLMNHRPITEDECALFSFGMRGKHSFWNKNVSFPISVIFCDEEKRVADIKYLQANQLDFVQPNTYNIKYVVEAHFDAPKKFNIKNGSELIINDTEISFK